MQCVLAANRAINGSVSAEETWRGEGRGGEAEAEAEAPPPGCPTCDWAAFKSLGSDRRRAVLARREAGVATGLSTERS